MGLAFHGDVALLPILGPVVGDIVVMVGYDLRIGPFDLSNIFVLGIDDIQFAPASHIYIFQITAIDESIFSYPLRIIGQMYGF